MRYEKVYEHIDGDDARFALIRTHRTDAPLNVAWEVRTQEYPGEEASTILVDLTRKQLEDLARVIERELTR